MLISAFCFPSIARFVPRAKLSTSEPIDPSASAPSVGKKSSLVHDHDAEAHPETHSAPTSKLLVHFRPSLSFLSDLYFGAHSYLYTMLYNHSLRRIWSSGWQPTSLGLYSRHSPSLCSTSPCGSSHWLDLNLPPSLPFLHCSLASPPSYRSLRPVVVVLFWLVLLELSDWVSGGQRVCGFVLLP
jgi:hypothetical protein